MNGTPRVFPKFGSSLEFSEPPWYRGIPTPYYDESHVELRARVRRFVDDEIIPFVSEWENTQTLPVKHLNKRMVELGIYGGQYPPEFGGGGKLIGGASWDAFHSLVFGDEINRIGSGGVCTALNVGVGIGLGPVLVGAQEPLRSRVMKDVLSADKFICLAISEPTAGSDVASVQTSATLDATGDHYIVNGQKKFISGAGYADYFTTAVRTPSGGLSVLLIPNGPGVTIRRLPTQGWLPSYTGHVIFDDVRVPKANLLGEEGSGFLIIMNNFNGERFAMIVGAIRAARICFHDAVLYAKRRKVFGKPLWSSPVIRGKAAEMARRIESSFSWAESLAFAMKSGVKPAKIAGQIALLKVQATQTMEHCAREASQIFGGNSYLRTGPGEQVERIYRDVRVMAIGGGSEEIMDDLAMRRLQFPSPSKL